MRDDIEGRELVADVRHQAWQETGWLALWAGLTALALLVAARGLDGVPPAWVWLIAGAVMSDLWTVLLRTGQAWRDVRKMARCATCRTTAVEIGRAWGVQDRCARHGDRASVGVA